MADVALPRQVGDHGPPTAPYIEGSRHTVGPRTCRVPIELRRLCSFQIVVELAGPQRAGVHEPVAKP